MPQVISDCNRGTVMWMSIIPNVSVSVCLTLAVGLSG